MDSGREFRWYREGANGRLGQPEPVKRVWLKTPTNAWQRETVHRRHACCYNPHIININCAPSDDFGFGDKFLRACGLRSVASVALLVLLVGLAISNLLMQRFSADYEGRARYILVPEIVTARPASKPALAASPPAPTIEIQPLQMSGSQMSNTPLGSRKVQSAFDPASSQIVSAQDLAAVRLSLSKLPTTASFAESLAPWDTSDEAISGMTVQSPAPSSGKPEISASARAKKAVRHAKNTRKKKSSPTEAFFRSIRRLLTPPSGDKPQKARFGSRE